MTAKTLVPMSKLGGKVPTQTDLLAPMSIPAPKFKPLHRDLIFDARDKLKSPDVSVEESKLLKKLLN